MTPTTPTPTTDDFVRTTRDLRFTALGGFLVLAALLVLTATLVIGDGVSGDGVGGGFTDAAFWMFPFAAAAGLVALVTPRALMPATPRRALVIAQYALGVLGVFLQILD
ncbi:MULTISPECIES: hypothetical protein [unclassified Streptomyces]|uniref:hypothetical protein n=1 Tax=unclassified Streptomyces TaxID=2593676 RepID=UPI002966A0F4|nr:hypothetical protein [Streptomyces sp. SJL17-1]